MENHDINPTEQYDPLGRDEEFEDDFEPDFTLEDDEEFEESLADALRREKEAKCPF
jgi:hypothetical protein